MARVGDIGSWRMISDLETKPFDSKVFLSVVGDGSTIENYGKDRIVFAQGDRADSVFYIQRGKVKLAIVSSRGKEAVIAILGAGFMALADAAARTLFAPTEVPIGVLLAVIGVPAFLYLYLHAAGRNQ